MSQRRLVVVVAALLAGCGGDSGSHPAVSKPTPPPQQVRAARVTQTIDLPGGHQVHVIEVPQDKYETTRCIVAVSASGAISASCPPRSDSPAD